MAAAQPDQPRRNRTEKTDQNPLVRLRHIRQDTELGRLRNHEQPGHTGHKHYAKNQKHILCRLHLAPIKRHARKLPRAGKLLPAANLLLPLQLLETGGMGGLGLPENFSQTIRASIDRGIILGFKLLPALGTYLFHDDKKVT
ncbi:hypothetical protein AC781_09200 [Akkermansia glycaniphila]|nr:hypothetical protein AC781_09200 [Akkermansia glycaniphila]